MYPSRVLSRFFSFPFLVTTFLFFFFSLFFYLSFSCPCLSFLFYLFVWIFFLSRVLRFFIDIVFLHLFPSLFVLAHYFSHTSSVSLLCIFSIILFLQEMISLFDMIIENSFVICQYKGHTVLLLSRSNFVIPYKKSSKIEK